MNLPNKLTMLRVLLVPFFVFFLMEEPEHPSFKWIALVIFAVASLTDMLDGMIARKYHLITNFGKFADPLADKMLVGSAMICLSVLGWVPVWMTLIIIIREFIISGFRLIAAEKGKVIAAGWWGKWKTAVTMIAIILQIIVLNEQGFGAGAADAAASASHPYLIACTVVMILMYVATALTVISLIDYLVKNKDVLSDKTDGT
ncbi:MAG: CDP-diacylglycerol--glycerol-3-phosphate 3-phosphatidyltransferase [Lachnospiraceae bacterium]|nr:CDP-diacylglycerol--glycerol-3-phosphate 3-phosphatidyltransferase [Lachnospiraceae bacterium]